MPLTENLKKYIRIALWTAGGFVAIVAIAIAIAAVIIPKKYPPEKVRAMVTEQLAAKIHRKIVLKDAQFNLFSGFKLTGLSVSNRSGAGWSTQPFLAADEISIGYRLLPLLWLQLELSEVKLEKPVILVERMGPTEYNFSDLMGASAPTTATPAASTSSASSEAVGRALALFSVAQVTLQDGQITYINHLYKPAQTIQLPKTNVTIKNISLSGGKTTFSINAPVVYGGTTYSFTAKGSERFSWNGQTLKSLKVEGECQGVKFKVEGDASSVVDDFAPVMKGEAALDLAKVGELMPKAMGPLPKDLALTGVVTAPFAVGGSLKKGFTFNGSVDLTSSELAFGTAFKKAKGTVCKADYQTVIGTDYVKVPSFDAALAGWVVKGSAAFTGMEAYPGDPKANPAIALALSAPSLPLKELNALSPMLKDFALSGELGMDFSVSAALKNPKGGSLKGGVDFKGLNVMGPNNAPFLQDLTGRLSMTDTAIDMPTMKFKLLGAPATASFKMTRFHAGELMDFAKCNALIAYSLDAADVDVEKVMASMGLSSGKAAGKKGETTTAAAAKSAPLDLRNAVSPGLQVNGKVSFKSFYYRKLRLENAVATTTLSNRVFKTTASVSGFSGKAGAAMSADLGKAPLPYGYSLDLTGVSAQSAINDAVDSFVTKNPEQYKDKVTGTMNFKFAGTGAMDANPAASLKGNGTFQIAGATLQGLAMLGGVMDSLKDNTKALKMDKVDGTLAVASRTVSITANSTGSFGKLRVLGGVDFDGKYAPEMRVETDVKKELLDSRKVFGALPSALQGRIDLDRAADAQGYIPVDFKFTGLVTDAPGLKAIDVTRLTKNVTGSYTKQITNKVTEKTGAAGQAVGNALKGLFKK